MFYFISFFFKKKKGNPNSPPPNSGWPTTPMGGQPATYGTGGGATTSKFPRWWLGHPQIPLGKWLRSPPAISWVVDYPKM